MHFKSMTWERLWNPECVLGPANQVTQAGFTTQEQLPLL